MTVSPIKIQIFTTLRLVQCMLFFLNKCKMSYFQSTACNKRKTIKLDNFIDVYLSDFKFTGVSVLLILHPYNTWILLKKKGIKNILKGLIKYVKKMSILISVLVI